MRCVAFLPCGCQFVFIVFIVFNFFVVFECACTRGRNGKGGKLLSRVYIYFVCVSICDDNNPFSVSSVIYIIGGRTENILLLYLFDKGVWMPLNCECSEHLIVHAQEAA